ncbi:methyltransferase domain-containing protein [Methylobacterium planeticum]|uniref:Methyltransferase domain-containing protein n=1 Tax=Methylobacterium planeticum TaxID=2615211 RepID=A0A6N6MXQ5_9HYPH|nr:methyltransferase domain-containing protein [Methylobacterium planeticum]KAB1075699.1 methyltransferase domain-containing protein [Methylobacterium planeticum]
MPTATAAAPSRTTPWKQAVARAFDGAEAYDRAAGIQRPVAEGLARRIAALPLPARPRILEVGCGTGFLTAALRARLPAGPMLVTDIAPGMLARCRARMGAAGDPGGLDFLAMDGERPCLEARPGFDLIASSLAAQWFEDLPGALAGLSRLLAPGGWLALATLAEGTFAEWAAAQRAHGLVPAALPYPPEARLAGLRLPGCTISVSVEPVREAHPDGHAFLAALRAIGAGTAGRAPLPAGTLRRVLRTFEAGGARVTYAVATCLVQRAADQAAEMSTRMLPRVACE